MTIIYSWLSAVALFLILHFGVMAELRRRLESDRTPAAIRPLSWFSVAAVLRTVSLAILVGTSLVGLLFLTHTWRGSATVEDISVTLELLRKLLDLTGKIDLGLTAFWLSSLTIGLAWLTYTQSRQNASSLFAEIDAAERQRVIDSYKADRWEALPPTELMVGLAGAYENIQNEQTQAKESGDDVLVAALDSKLDEVRSLYFRIDAERRIAVEVSEPFANDLVLPPSANWRDRLRHALFNRGVLKSMGLGGRVLAFVGLVLLIPASASFALGIGRQAVEQHIVRLDQIRIRLGIDAAESDLKQALQVAAVLEPPGQPIDDDKAEAALAEVFDRDFNAQVALIAAPANLQSRMARATVRDQILQQYAHAQGQVEAHSGPDTAHAAMSDLDGPRDRMRKRLHAIRRDNAAAWQNIKRAMPTQSDFLAAATRTDLYHALSGEVYRTAFAGGAQEIGDAYDAHAIHYVAELVRGGDLDKSRSHAFSDNSTPHWTAETEARLAALHQHSDSDGHLLDRAMREHPPTLHAPSHTPEQFLAAEKIIGEMPASARSAQALYGFGDLLPGVLGDETHSPAGRLAAKIDPNGWNASPAPLLERRSNVAFQRARSYSSLRGFSRVGGVLIGRPPESEKGRADIIDIAWTKTEGSQIRLSLKGRDGSLHQFGPYPASLVLHGLTYAADQRPLAITMITANPVPDLKIITHPALLDTPTGCRAVAIDRVTDEATFRSDYRLKATSVVDASHALYRLAWGTVVGKNITSAPGFGVEKRQLIGMEARRAVADGHLELQFRYSELRAALKSEASLPLLAKTEYYDVGLAKLATECVNNNKSLGGLPECLASGPAGHNLATLVERIPEYQIWSGVRELPYEIDGQLNFLRRQPNSSELWPFDFVLQTAFTRQGLFDRDEIIDERPWEFPAIHKQLVLDVAQLVRASSERRNIVATMRDFAVLQRLFRAALNGQLGDDFPVTKLATLSGVLNEGKAGRTAYKTPRWNVKPVELLFARNLTENVDRVSSESPGARMLIERTGVAFANCGRASMSSTKGEMVPPPCDFSELKAEFGRIAKNSEAPYQQELVEELSSMLSTLELRRALGVHGTENRADKRCPPL